MAAYGYYERAARCFATIQMRARAQPRHDRRHARSARHERRYHSSVLTFSVHVMRGA